MTPYYPLQELVSSIGPGCDLAQDNSRVLQRIGTKILDKREDTALALLEVLSDNCLEQTQYNAVVV